MTVFHLVRHGSHDLLGRVLVGRGPVAISAQGHAEAARVAKTQASVGLTGIVSSPQQRAMETAGAISKATDLPVQTDAGLDEIDFGQWTGASFATLGQDDRWQAFNVFRSSATVPGGEAMLAAQARIVGTIQRLRAENPDARLALVSHADMIKAALMHFLGMPLELIHRIDIAPASTSVLELFGRDAVIRAINLPPV